MRRRLDQRELATPAEAPELVGMSVWSAALVGCGDHHPGRLHPQAHADGLPFDETSAPAPGPSIPWALLAFVLTVAAHDAGIIEATVAGLDTVEGPGTS